MLSNYVEMFSYFEPLKDGLFLADDGECYTCTYGIFDAESAECTCSVDDLKVANSDTNGCECDAGYIGKNFNRLNNKWVKRTRALWTSGSLKIKRRSYSTGGLVMFLSITCRFMSCHNATEDQ